MTAFSEWAPNDLLEIFLFHSLARNGADVCLLVEGPKPLTELRITPSENLVNCAIEIAGNIAICTKHIRSPNSPYLLRLAVSQPLPMHYSGAKYLASPYVVRFRPVIAAMPNGLLTTSRDIGSIFSYLATVLINRVLGGYKDILHWITENGIREVHICQHPSAEGAILAALSLLNQEQSLYGRILQIILVPNIINILYPK